MIKELDCLVKKVGAHTVNKEVESFEAIDHTTTRNEYTGFIAHGDLVYRYRLIEDLHDSGCSQGTINITSMDTGERCDVQYQDIVEFEYRLRRYVNNKELDKPMPIQ